MATSDEDLQKKQQNVVDLRQKVADVNAEREKKERELTNDITAGELDAEAARLEALLVEADRISKLDAKEEDGTPVVAPAPAASPAPNTSATAKKES